MNLSEPTHSRVSVLIRVLNEVHSLRRLFECLRTQKLDRPFEVVVIDNESDDGSADVARKMGARVFTLPRSLFGYGRALNVGVRLCRGDLVILLSAHSWPQGDDWLIRMVDCVEDGGVAAAYCRQLADGKVCQQEKTRFNMFAVPNYKLDAEKLVQRCKSGEDIYEICCFSNSAAIVRREVASAFRSGTCRSRRIGRSSWIASWGDTPSHISVLLPLLTSNLPPSRTPTGSGVPLISPNT